MINLEELKKLPKWAKAALSLVLIACLPIIVPLWLFGFLVWALVFGTYTVFFDENYVGGRDD